MIHKQIPGGKCISTIDEENPVISTDDLMKLADDLAESARKLIDYLDNNIFISSKHYRTLRTKCNNYKLAKEFSKL